MLTLQSSRAEVGLCVKGVAVRVGGWEGCPCAARTTCPHILGSRRTRVVASAHELLRALAKRTCATEGEQTSSAHSVRIPVQRDREVVYAKLRHSCLPTADRAPVERCRLCGR